MHAESYFENDIIEESKNFDINSNSEENENEKNFQLGSGIGSQKSVNNISVKEKTTNEAFKNSKIQRERSRIENSSQEISKEKSIIMKKKEPSKTVSKSKILEEEEYKKPIEIPYTPIIIKNVRSTIAEVPKGQISNLIPQEKQDYQNEVDRLKMEYEELRQTYDKGIKKEDDKIEEMMNKYKEEKQYIIKYNEDQKKQNEIEFNKTEKLLNEKIEKMMNDMNTQLKKEEENIKNRNEKRLQLKKKN